MIVIKALLVLFLLGVNIFLYGRFSVVLSEIPTPTLTPSVTSTPTITPSTSSSSPTPTPTPDTSSQQKELQERIKQYEQKLGELRSQEKTLSSQIKIMDNQISLTEARISAAKQKIEDLENDIGVAKDKILDIGQQMSVATEVLLKRISTTYEVGNIQPWQLFLTSDNISNFMTRLKYLKIIQINDKRNIYAAEQLRVNYSYQKKLLEDSQKEEEALKQKMVSYTDQLNKDKGAKQELLSVTKNDESRYQKLLQEARAQINAFKSFASARSGGAVSILPPQSSPDGWYYNQRDERWGRNTIGSSSEQMWDVGCLITATTMVLKKHGQDITPSDTASNSSYYFSDTAYMLIPWLGGKFTSVWTADLGAIDSKLSSSEPVIVGVRAGTYGMHFVVLKSGSNGDYIMNDPWYGPDLKFTDYYSTGQIFQYGYYKG